MSDMPKNLARPGRAKARATAFAGAMASPVAAMAVCTCGFGDGQFTLSPIAVDGNVADWASVHADPDNNVCDGPAGGLTDRDAPVQSTGRDLTHFAYTWDNNNVYLFTERFGSASNTQSFVYYGDIDNDGLMETGEPVIGVTWRGSNRTINVYVFTYVAAASGGDPMLDGGGFGDGYTLPGSFANVPSTGNPNRSGTWGSADGLQMEFFVTWAELGLSPGTPFTFHVASSNAALGASSFTAQVDDNLSGCGGGLGSTIVPGVTFTANEPLAGFAGQTAVAAHTLTNVGSSDDFFDFSSSSSGDFSPTISYYEDTDGSGTLTGADVLLTDTDGDGDINTGIVAPSASMTVLAAYDVPISVADGDSAAISVTASSDYEPAANDFVTDTITVAIPPQIFVAKDATTIADPVNGSGNPKSIPGADIRYVLTVRNEGAGTADADSLSMTDAIPAGSCLRVLDIGGAGSGPVAFLDGSPSSNLSYNFLGLNNTTDDLEFSSDGGFNFNYSPSADPSGCDSSVTHIRINPQGTFAADLGSGSPQATFTFRVVIE
jgi:hypothetical protein